MTARTPYRGRRAAFWRDEDGSTLVEFAIAVSLFLLIIFGLIDFGRLGYHVVTTERAVHAAARIAAVRPPACAGVPTILQRAPDAPADAEYGISCGAGGPICANPGVISCPGSTASATANEAWAVVQSVLPPGATIANLRFSYGFDPDLGFLGGPYVPVVTVELIDVCFDFVTPLSALAVAAGEKRCKMVNDSDADLTLPRRSTSLPGEDLAQGGNG